MKVDKEIWEHLRDEAAFSSLYEMQEELFDPNQVYKMRNRGSITLDAVYAIWDHGVDAEIIFKLLRKYKV